MMNSIKNPLYSLVGNRNKADIFLRKFEKRLDSHQNMWYNIIVGREVIKLIEKIKELTEILKELSKLTDEAVNVVGKLTLLAMALITLINVIK